MSYLIFYIKGCMLYHVAMFLLLYRMFVSCLCLLCILLLYIFLFMSIVLFRALLKTSLSTDAVYPLNSFNH